MPGGAVATKRRAQLIKEIYWTPLTLTPALCAVMYYRYSKLPVLIERKTQEGIVTHKSS